MLFPFSQELGQRLPKSEPLLELPKSEPVFPKTAPVLPKARISCEKLRLCLPISRPQFFPKSVADFPQELSKFPKSVADFLQSSGRPKSVADFPRIPGRFSSKCVADFPVILGRFARNLLQAFPKSLANYLNLEQISSKSVADFFKTEFSGNPWQFFLTFHIFVDSTDWFTLIFSVTSATD